jgi:tripartite-type tricarboxylate transporter receptor subunit TctC
MPLSVVCDLPTGLLVSAKSHFTSVQQVIAEARANPGKLTYGSGGVGSSNHLAGASFASTAGINLLHVPYRGAAPALTDLLGGQVQVYFGPIPSSIEYIRTGKLRALAVTTATRSDALPDIPTMGEFLPGYEASTWNGLGAPKGTPGEIIEKLNSEINVALADPTIKARIADLGGTVFSSTPAGFGKFIADETEKWSKVIKFAGINLL